MWDYSAFVGTWPFRELGECSPERLERLLRSEGFRGAHVSPLDALLHADPAPSNARWGALLRGRAFFRFIPVLNPRLPGWRETLDARRQEWGAAGIRLLPGFHGYALTDDRATAAARAAAGCGLPVYVQLRMQDARSAHPLLQVPDTDWRDVPALARRCPGTTLIVAGAKWAEARGLAAAFAELPRLFLELSHLEYVDGLSRFVRECGAARLLVGTHAPLFVPASARLKIEHARLSAADRTAIQEGNGASLFPQEPGGE
jgi:uncharacterized protein